MSKKLSEKEVASLKSYQLRNTEIALALGNIEIRKYELEKDDSSVEKIPASEYSYYEGMEVEKMDDSYYFKVNVKVENSNEDSSLPAFSFFSCLILITTISLFGRR